MKWKKIAGIAVIAFLVYFLVRSPVESATAVRNLATTVGNIANDLVVSLTTFFRTLF